MSWERSTDLLAAAVELGYPADVVRGVAAEPDGTLIVTVLGSDGDPLQTLHEPDEVTS